MAAYILCLGSNDGDRRLHILAAARRLGSIAKNLTMSELYELPSCTGIGSPYINAVAALETDMPRESLAMFLKSVEKDEGRTPESKAEGRIPLDIDIVIANGRILREDDFSRSYFLQGYNQLVAKGIINPKTNLTAES